jgi:hypothetical protein
MAISTSYSERIQLRRVTLSNAVITYGGTDGPFDCGAQNPVYNAGSIMIHAGNCAPMSMAVDGMKAYWEVHDKNDEDETCYDSSDYEGVHCLG